MSGDQSAWHADFKDRVCIAGYETNIKFSMLFLKATINLSSACYWGVNCKGVPLFFVTSAVSSPLIA